MIDLLSHPTWSHDPRAGRDVRVDGDVAERGSHGRTASPAIDPRVGTVLRVLLRAGDAESLPETLHGILDGCIAFWASCHALVRTVTDDGAVFVARDATSGGSVESPELTARYGTVESGLLAVQLAAGCAPQDVRTLVLCDGGEELGRLWMVFARQGAVPDGDHLTWLVPAIVMALRRAHERQSSRQTAQRLQRRVDESERRLSAVLESVPDPLMVIEDQSTRIAYANQAAVRRFGPETPDVGTAGGGQALVGRTLEEVAFMAKLEAAGPDAGVLHRVKTMVNHRRAWVYRVEDTRAVERLRTLARWLHRDATLGRLVGATLADALAAEASVVTALASMQFELFNARFAPTGPGALDACMALVDDARDAAGRLRRVLGGIAGIARAETEAPRRIDAVTVVESVLATLDPQLSRHATVVRSLAPVPTVATSAGPLGLVVLHLLVNAVHAMAEDRSRPHTLRVETRVETRTEKGVEVNTVVIAVSDDGCGIPAERLTTVFEGFAPGWAGTAGLGLASSREIVEQMGGWIEATSEPGVGSVFQIVLPVG